MPSETTAGIRVSVRSLYLSERSDPTEGRYAFAYQIQIANEGKETVQLRRRHWIITDGNGDTEEVEGEGVVGEQPVLAPGAIHEYTSGAIIETPFGTMEGSYQMIGDGGRGFDIAIPRFRLERPGTLQ
ncbi:MAG: Co2+/Mg2+ efflux protein ApaG [Deltaproteobacteria bacterium]